MKLSSLLLFWKILPIPRGSIPSRSWWQCKTPAGPSWANLGKKWMLTFLIKEQAFTQLASTWATEWSMQNLLCFFTKARGWNISLVPGFSKVNVHRITRRFWSRRSVMGLRFWTSHTLLGYVDALGQWTQHNFRLFPIFRQDHKLCHTGWMKTHLDLKDICLQIQHFSLTIKFKSINIYWG